MTEFARPFPVDRIGAGVEVTLEATPTECASLAGRFRIPAVESLRCTYRLHRSAGVIVADGDLDARIVQTCIVTLDDFSQHVGERFTVHFVAEAETPDEGDPLSLDLLPYDGVTLDLGETTAEQLALAMDPYPRAPGATLPEDAADEMESAFAALVSRKPH
ncbi:MAG: DUF177 domain-containing protein [Pseudomonadota bacterium]|nr:DUF177 domain-containing protein [Pseudomonadota bacterium]